MVRFSSGMLECEFNVFQMDYVMFMNDYRQLKADLFTILDRFVEQAAVLDKLYVIKDLTICFESE